MHRHEKIADALKILPVSIWGEPDSRSWTPARQDECISSFRETIEQLHELYNATAVLTDHEYPVRLSVTCIGPSIQVTQKDKNDPAVTYTVNEGLIEAIGECYALPPDHNLSDDLVILFILEATGEYLGKRLMEEIDFLDHITEEIKIESE